MPSLRAGKHAKVLTLAAAGTLSIAGAVSATAVTRQAHANAAAVRATKARETGATASAVEAVEAVEAANAARDARIHEVAVKKVAEKAAARKAADRKHAATEVVAVSESGSPQQIAEGMLGQFGWSASQFSCLEPLWAQESGWSVSAENPSSGAYGIPQALPGSKMAGAGADWQTDAATQIRWGLRYIQGTYGSPCAAWSHEEEDGWY